MPEQPDRPKLGLPGDKPFNVWYILTHPACNPIGFYLVLAIVYAPLLWIALLYGSLRMVTFVFGAGIIIMVLTAAAIYITTPKS